MAKPRRCTQKHKPMSPSSLTVWPCFASNKRMQTGKASWAEVHPQLQRGSLWGLPHRQRHPWSHGSWWPHHWEVCGLGGGAGGVESRGLWQQINSKWSETAALWALKPPGVGRKESGGPAGQGRTCRNLHWREGRALGGSKFVEEGYDFGKVQGGE